MTLVLRPPTTSWELLAPAGPLFPDLYGTSASAGVPSHVAVTRPTSTSAGDARRTSALQPVEAEVRAPRDEINLRAKLTRQQIGRAIGVDRRSLSGFVSGAIRPTSGRLAALRTLATLVREIDRVYPGRARDVLLARGDDGLDLLDHVAVGNADVLAGWRRIADRPSAIRITRRSPTRKKPPLYGAALEAALAGRLAVPARRPVVRRADLEEIDLDEAVAFAEPTAQRARRRGNR